MGMMRFFLDGVCLSSVGYRLVCVLVWSIFIIQLRACPMGFFGDRCGQECSANCISLLCNDTTGACTGGCKEGFVGDVCDEECKEGFYGNNCTVACPKNCATPKCHHVTGACEDGCKVGQEGEQCEEKCSGNTYGENCQNNCSVNCVAGCHPVSGQCLNGCKKNFWGSDCSLSADFKSNPEPQKAKFYQHLSAESRSVLLYMLMGEYEQTLERAQMEVSRGLMQRNEIRQLLQGQP